MGDRSGFQTFVTAILGFVAVAEIAGGAFLFHAYRQLNTVARQAANAAQLEALSSLPRSAVPAVQHERRAESPAPLIGAEDESEISDAPPAAGSVAAFAEAADDEAREPMMRGKSFAPGLEVTRHLDRTGSGSSAEAVVRNAVFSQKTAGKTGTKFAKAAATRRGPAPVASEHYGVTSRNELMGRAAGPVYNIKGGTMQERAASEGKMAADVNAQIAEIEERLDASGITGAQRADLLKQLAKVKKDVARTQ